VWRDARIVFGDEYDERDVVGTAAHMWEAGTGTSGSATASALYWLLPSPELQEQVRAGGGNSVMRVVEESLRLAGPVSFRPPRFAVHDTEVGGVPIKKGERVISLIGAANRDPQKYACPHDVDLGRRAPRDHFAFWAGRRICAGQGLGRATAEANVAVLLERVRDLRPDPGAEPPSYQGQMLRAWKPLHTQFGAA
jgi:cytochrome P450